MKKILLLDDSPTIQRVVLMSFTAEKGYEVKAASTPAAANEILATFKPDVVVAYVRFMGDANPNHFLTLQKSLPSILLLAESNEPLAAFENAGFHNFLRKPFHTEELKKAIENLLSNPVNDNDTVSEVVEAPPQPARFERTVSAPPAPPTQPVTLTPPPVRRSAPPPPPPRNSGEEARPRRVPPPPPPVASRNMEPAEEGEATYFEASALGGLPGRTLPENRPQTTLDTEALERAYRKTMSLDAKVQSEPVTPSTSTAQRRAPNANVEQALSSTSRDEIARFVKELVEKEMSQLRVHGTLPATLRAEAIAQMQDWLSREFVGIAKQVLREEIKKLLDGL